MDGEHATVADLAAGQARILEALERLEKHAGKQRHPFYSVRLGRGLIVAALLAASYFLTNAHTDVTGDLVSSIHTISGITGALFAAGAVIITGLRMARLPVSVHRGLPDAMTFLEFVIGWPVVLAAAADYASSFVAGALFLGAAGIALSLVLFVDFGWSCGRHGHRFTPWQSPWITHAVFGLGLGSTVVLWDNPYLHDLRHQLINAGSDASIANATVLAGLALAATSYVMSRVRGSVAAVGETAPSAVADPA